MGGSTASNIPGMSLGNRPVRAGCRSVVATTPTGPLFVVLAIHGHVFVDARGRGHRLGDEVVDELRVNLEDQFAEDQVIELAVGDDLRQSRAFGLEVSEKVSSLLVSIDRIGQTPLVPLAVRDDLGAVFGEDVMNLLDGIVPGHRDLGAIEQEHGFVSVDWQGVTSEQAVMVWFSVE